MVRRSKEYEIVIYSTGVWCGLSLKHTFLLGRMLFDLHGEGFFFFSNSTFQMNLAHFSSCPLKSTCVDDIQMQ